MSVKEPSEYAMLPAGTVVKYGAMGDAPAAFKPLITTTAIGATGQTGSFIEANRLIDTSKKFIRDLPEGPDKEFGFQDDPSDPDFQAFLDAAANGDTVQLQVTFPNGRIALMVVVLNGWQFAEPNLSEVMQITVSGKQNSVAWSKSK